MPPDLLLNLNYRLKYMHLKLVTFLLDTLYYDTEREYNHIPGEERVLLLVTTKLRLQYIIKIIFSVSSFDYAETGSRNAL
jgi:hypothetical protein